MTPEPPRGCPRCARLAAYRRENANRHPDWFNGAVPSFGDPRARLLVLGLAPGVAGANRTGRPFTGDYAGALLYATLAKFGLANGRFAADTGDGLQLDDCMVSNAVRCVPPQNRPTPAEVATCRPFLAARLASLPRLRAVVCLGRIAHDSLLRALGARPADHPFAHGARHEVGRLAVFDSYHCSRLNTNTGRLTPAMFEAVLAEVRRLLDARAASAESGGEQMANMKRYLAVYLGTEAAVRRAQWDSLDERTRKAREAAGLDAWMAWGVANAAAIVDQGTPLGRTKRASSEGIADVKNSIVGYVIVQAESHEAAARLFETHPHFAIFPGDSVEIMECLPLPAR